MACLTANLRYITYRRPKAIGITVTKNSVTALIVGEYELIRAGIRSLLEINKIKTVGETSSKRALEVAIKAKPAILLHDIDGCPLNCAELFTAVKTRLPHAHIVVLTASYEDAVFRHAYRCGARAVVSKASSPQTLIAAIENVVCGEIWLDKHFLRSVLEGQVDGLVSAKTKEETKLDKLSKRESNILCLVGQGYRNKKIAECLSISPSTVRHHLSSIFNKLDVSDRMELMMLTYRVGITDPRTDMPKPNNGSPVQAEDSL